MRIAFISHLSEVSGATVALLETASAFNAHGHTTALILPGNGPIADRAENRKICTVILKNPESALVGAGVWQKLYLGGSRFAFVVRLVRFLRRERVDVAYINSSISLFPGIAATLARVPVIWHIHESLNRDDGSSRLRRWLIPKMAGGLLYASESGKQLLPPGKTPSIIVRNKVAMAELQAVRTQRQRIGAVEHSDTHGVTLLANGVYHLKGADTLLSAAAILEKLASVTAMLIVIVGRTDSEPLFYNRLTELTSKLQATDVSFPGLQPGLAPLFADATLYISASRNEALPIAIVEAMAAGVPVIATAVGDCADLLENGRCGWVVPPDDPAALAGAIAEALGDPAESRARAAAAAEKVDRLYGKEEFWEPLMAFVEQTARRGRWKAADDKGGVSSTPSGSV